MKKRVVVTGLGVMSSLGHDIETFWSNSLAGRINVKEIPQLWKSLYQSRSQYYAPLVSWDQKDFLISKVENLRLDPQTTLCLCATVQALQHAQLHLTCQNKKTHQYCIEGIDSSRASVFIGSAGAGMQSLFSSHANYVFSKPSKELALLSNELEDSLKKRLDTILEKIKPGRISYYSVIQSMSDACSSAIGVKFLLNGINQTFCSGCSSGTQAIGQAFKSLQRGECEFAITGGADYLMDEAGTIFTSLDIAQVLASDSTYDRHTVNRPFDKNRSGFLFSEGGAGILILEEREHALKRGASILAEVVGYGESFSSYGAMVIEPDGNSLKIAINKALGSANIQPSSIDYINAHGTGTQNNDAVEAQVIKELFINNPSVNSSKSLLGHSLCACGGLEAVLTVLSLKEQLVHPTLNIETPVENLNFPSIACEKKIDYAISQSFSFGGQRSVLVMKRG